MQFKFSEKPKHGQKPKQQSKIKNIYKAMKQNSDNSKLSATEKNLNGYLKKLKQEKTSPTARLNNTFGSKKVI